MKDQANCQSEHHCDGHVKEHQHGPACGHEPVKHEDHTDYVVEGHLHHQHGQHCDHHGAH